MLRWASVVMAAVALASACSTQVVQTMEVPPATDPTPSPTTPPTANAEQVLLRLSTEPTMKPYPGGTVERPPAFTLYADGRVIYVDYEIGTQAGTEISLKQAQLSVDQVADLIAFALEDGGITDATGYYDDDGAATDQDNTVFDIHASGVDKRVLAYALGDTSSNNPDATIRAKLELLAIRLQNFGSDIANGGGEDLGVYEPEAYRVTVDELFGPQPNPEAVGEWPWPDLVPSDFLTQPEHGRQLTPEQTTAVSDTPLSAPNDLLVEAPDGAAYYYARIRALLPDEVVPTH